MTSRILFVTGLSGAGMSSSLKVLEDIGYEVFDNFPLPLIDELIAKTGDEARPVALGLDTRTRGFDAQLLIQKAEQYNARVLFITADEAVLQQRFTETRRVHPLATDRPVSAGIKKELALLYPLREIADPLVDTTEFTIHDLKRALVGYFGDSNQKRMNINVMSFGFKNGLPREADIVMDVRFLKNPHWEPDIKPMSGLDQPVQDYIATDASLTPFVDNFKNLLEPLLDRYRHEGKTYLTVALGCTGGKHRSVYVATLISEWLQQKGLSVSTEHRDLYRY
jgi:UPF0042 nucleotide-binding protein